MFASVCVCVCEARHPLTANHEPIVLLIFIVPLFIKKKHLKVTAVPIRARQ